MRRVLLRCWSQQKGKRYYFTTENEAPRLHDEEFGALDFEPVLFPWYADETTAAAQKLAGGPLGSDTSLAGTVAVNLYPAARRSE